MARKETAPATEPEVAAAETPATNETTTEETAPATEPEVAAALVKVRMKTTSAGPNTSCNWSEGQIRTVSATEAASLFESGLAEIR